MCSDHARHVSNVGGQVPAFPSSPRTITTKTAPQSRLSRRYAGCCRRDNIVLRDNMANSSGSWSYAHRIAGAAAGDLPRPV